MLQKLLIFQLIIIINFSNNYMCLKLINNNLINRKSIKNVCKTLKDYETIQSNPNCWYNPDVDATPPEIVKRYGYPFEKYKLMTKDGYIISLFRIPSNKENPEPVLLQHGIGLHSIAWLITGRNSPAFQLSDKGFDVWLGNARGTRFSTGHMNYTINDREYWNFSFHEMGLYDFPSMIDFIYEKTAKKKITIISHSMGATASLIYSSIHNYEANQKLNKLILLAPVAYFYRFRSMILENLIPYRFALQEFFNNLGLNAFGQFTKIQQKLMRSTCQRFPLINLCFVLNNAITGLNNEEFKAEYFPIFLNNYPTGTSLKTIQHYAQIFESKGHFQQYDYKNFNRQFYNSNEPPEYDMKKISIPVHLLYGKNDLLADELDVQILYNKLETTKRKTITSIFENEKLYFSHNDFIFGKDIERLYNLIEQLIRQNQDNLK